jgi:hypothetical protein
MLPLSQFGVLLKRFLHCGCAGGRSGLVVIVGTWKCLECIGVMTDVDAGPSHLPFGACISVVGAMIEEDYEVSYG